MSRNAACCRSPGISDGPKLTRDLDWIGPNSKTSNRFSFACGWSEKLP